MALSLYNTHPVHLTCTIGTASDLQIHHGSTALASYGNSLFNELPRTGQYTDAEVSIADFTHNGQTHQVHVWEALPTGGVQKWSRASGCSISGAHHHYGETNVLVVAVPPGVSIPEPTSTDGPPAPGTTQSTIKIKIRRQGSMPD